MPEQNITQKGKIQSSFLKLNFVAIQSDLRVRIWLLFGVFLIAISVFLLWKIGDNWTFILKFRSKKVLTITLVGMCIGVSTIVFQTVTDNRILTPAIIGLDKLYLLVQIMAIFLLGSDMRNNAPSLLIFLINIGVMMAAAILLFGGLAHLIGRDTYRLLLVGVIFGTLCQSLINFLARLIDPVEYANFQSVRFAQFNRVPEQLLAPSACLMVIGMVFLWRKRFVLDILSLGQLTATSLGVRYRMEVLQIMLVVSALVSVSTALVGPILFLGLLVSALTYHFFPCAYHRILLPASAWIAVTILLLGQLVFERVLAYASILSVVTEGLGGMLFLYFLLRRKT